jgi:hypothetical protein
MFCSSKHNKARLVIQKLNTDDRIVAESKDICNGLNRFFTNIGENLVEDLMKDNPTWSNAELRKYLPQPIKNWLLCAPITAYALSRVVNSLIISKSPGSDETGPRIIKGIVSIICEPLLHFYNVSFLTGVVPEKLEIAMIIPVYKKGDPSLPGKVPFLQSASLISYLKT